MFDGVFFRDCGFTREFSLSESSRENDFLHDPLLIEPERMVDPCGENRRWHISPDGSTEYYSCIRWSCLINIRKTIYLPSSPEDIADDSYDEYIEDSFSGYMFIRVYFLHV